MEIVAEHLARRYGMRWALADVSFTVASGETVMVAGRNGSGKSTLFRLLSTAIHADAGRASIGGLDLVRDRDRIRRVVALLSHYSYLYESLTARENLEIVARFLGVSDIGPALERVGLSTRAGDVVQTFSAGMRKRLSIARVLLQRPQVVMLDEPYGALDPEGFALVDELVREWKREGATVLMATHQVEHVVAMADRSIIIEEGRIASQPLRESAPC
ncbi:MAG: heme ABC exporter ATP-binding protein CcmA [Acidobacteriota bacterium]